MMADADIKRRVDNHLIFIYAREILRECRKINQNRCIGCQYNDPSQLHHECLTRTDHEVVMFHYIEALQNLQHSKIPKLYEDNSDYLKVDKAIITEYKDSFNWDWWFEKSPEKRYMEERIEEALDILINFQ